MRPGFECTKRILKPEAIFWTAAASEALRRFGLEGKVENLIHSLCWRTEPKRRRRSALPAQSKESPA